MTFFFSGFPQPGAIVPSGPCEECTCSESSYSGSHHATVKCEPVICDTYCPAVSAMLLSVIPTTLKYPPLKVSVIPQCHFLSLSFKTGLQVYKETWTVLRHLQSSSLHNDCGRKHYTCASSNYPCIHSLLVNSDSLSTLSFTCLCHIYLLHLFSWQTNAYSGREYTVLNSWNSTSSYETSVLTKNCGSNCDTKQWLSETNIEKYIAESNRHLFALISENIALILLKG